jgi:hypothetical protein
MPGPIAADCTEPFRLIEAIPSHSGTPATVDSENAPITTPMARPRRSNGMASPITVCTSAFMTPPNHPAASRATISMP